MTEPPISFRRELAKQSIIAFFIILIIAVLAQIVASTYRRSSSRLESEGIATAATVTSVEQYEEFDLTDLAAENRRTNDDGAVITVVQYEFETETGEIYADEYKSKNLTNIPVVGQKFEMRYAESDPTLHEVRFGHFERNAAAIYWIAVFFAGLTLAYALWGIFQSYRQYNSRTERRKRRMQELAK